ncbi:MAG: HAMP domain-containing sensor histidine kinase [Proteobacteria bacterium]|nr:HAMP domain-containing sensor histidine kinase [Pseudomonadota bacterium]
MTGSADPDRIELGRLVPELDELIEAVTRAFGGTLAVYDPRGQRLAGTEAAGPPTRAFEHDGLRLADLASDGPRAAEAMELFANALSLLVHHANARELAATTHEAAMRLTFAELTEHNLRLTRAVSRLEELDRLKSNFLATMSHELRTPLTSVIGYAEMMVEGIAGPVTQDQRDYLNTILNKAVQLLGLITTVLDVASLESGQLALERTQLSLADVVASEVATFQGQAVRRGISIEFAVSESSHIVGDRRKIRQVVSSLLSNAVKFTPDRGKVGVTVKPGTLSPTGDDPAMQLVVSDSGIGIPVAEVAKIFEPFFQVDSSSTRAFGGTGLGLTLAKAYVEAHGGRIWVDTQPGHGSTFTVAFPMERGSA